MIRKMTFVLRIRKEKLKFLGHTICKVGLHNLALTGYIWPSWTRQDVQTETMSNLFNGRTRTGSINNRTDIDQS